MEQLCPILDRTTDAEKTAFCRDSWLVVRCRETDFIYLANPPSYAQLETEFAWEKTLLAERQRRVSEEPVVARVSSFAKTLKTVVRPKRNKVASLAMAELMARRDRQPCHVLDVGCGWGVLLAELQRRGAAAGLRVIPVGVEVSRHLATTSERNLASVGGRVLCGNALDATAELEPESIGLAVMSSFLEHECQPLRLLRQLREVLAPDGSVVVKVPNFDCWNRAIRGNRWCGFRYPDHVNYFTPKTLARLAREAGFRVRRNHLLNRFPLSDNMYAVLVTDGGRDGSGPPGRRLPPHR